MKKATSFFLTAIMILLVGCNRSTTNNSTTISSEKSGSTEIAMDATSEDINVPSEEKVYHCFYMKGDALYFADSKNNTSPLKLTEDLVNSGWYDVGTMNSLAGTLFCTYNEETGLAFYSDYGNSNLYYKDTNNPNSGAVHIADGIASGYTRYIPEKSVVYYVSRNLELYEYDIVTGTETMVAEQITDVTKSDESDIVYRTDSGLFAKNAHEEPYPMESNLSSAGDGFDSSSVFREITTYQNGERYYLSLDSSTDELVLCYWNGSSVSELYRHQKKNYHAEVFDDSPMIALTFPSVDDESQIYNGDMVIAIRDQITTMSSSSVDYNMKFNQDGTKFIYIEAEDKNHFRLMSCDISDNGVNNPVIVATNVGKIDNGFCWNDENGIYYIKTDSNKWGHLYYNETEADSSRIFGVIGMWNKKLLYKTDSAEAPYTLKASNHGTALTVGDNVSFVNRQNEALWLIANYNTRSQTGDLTLYLNGESTLIDSNVIRIIT